MPSGYYTVLEDDVILGETFNKKYLHKLKSDMGDLDYLNIGCVVGCAHRYCLGPFPWLFGIHSKSHETSINDNMYSPKYITGTQGYIISNVGAKNLLNLAVGIGNHIDIFINNLHAAGKIKLATLRVPLVDSAWDDSNNGSTSLPKICGMPLGWVLTVATYEKFGIKLNVVNIIMIIMFYMWWRRIN